MASVHIQPPGVLAPVHDIRGLRRGEHLVLFAFRAMALGRADCPILHRTFTGVAGGEAEGALMHMLAFVRMVGWSGQRRVQLHHPGCVGLSLDEQRVLGVICAAQASFSEGEERLYAQLSDLLDCAPSEACLMAAQSVAAALTLAGLDLPCREIEPPSRPSDATLH